MLDNERAIAVLDKVAQEGQWGKKMEPGTAQGLGMHAQVDRRLSDGDRRAGQGTAYHQVHDRR